MRFESDQISCVTRTGGFSQLADINWLKINSYYNLHFYLKKYYFFLKRYLWLFYKLHQYIILKTV
jgi:hypothetical protein